MRQRILIDTNLIIAAHRYGFWKALAGKYAVETVRECVTETQTGHLNRKPHENIDQNELERSLAARPHEPSDIALLEIGLLGGGGLDDGERHLWAHAIHDDGVWRLAGPDGASVDFGVDIGRGDQLVSLESLIDDKKLFRRRVSGDNFTETWLRARVAARLLRNM